MVFAAGPDNLPISTIFPSLTATSPRNAGIPEPSTIRPFLISRSYAIGVPPRSIFQRLRVVADYSTAAEIHAAQCARVGRATAMRDPRPPNARALRLRARAIG